MATRRNKVQTLLGRKYSVASKRKFTGGEIVQPKGDNRKFIVKVNGHETDYGRNGDKHTFYNICRGSLEKWVRSDRLTEVTA